VRTEAPADYSRSDAECKNYLRRTTERESPTMFSHPPSPRITSAPAVSAEAADADKTGEGPGVRGPSANLVIQIAERSVCIANAENGLLPVQR
jgi:hypothetical protein